MRVEAVSGPKVVIPDDVFAAAYAAAMKIAEYKAKKFPYAAEALTDAATDAVLWARDHCTDAATFQGMALAAARSWTFRAVAREAVKLKRRPPREEMPRQIEAPPASPVGPMLIEELPDDLAFVVRLYMVDGYTLREIGLLTGHSRNTVDRMIHKAAELVAGEKRPAEKVRLNSQLTRRRSRDSRAAGQD